MRTRGAWLVLVPLVLVAGACSSSGPDDAAAPTTTAGVVTASTTTAPAADPLIVTSSAFDDGARIPAAFACAQAGGAGDSPPLAWSNVPPGTKTLVLVVHDPDVPIPGGFTHLVTQLPAGDGSLESGSNRVGSGPMLKWIPMCPPSGTHHYEFTLYAFPASVDLPATLDKAAIDAVADQALATATLTGLFAAP